jgi:hypothetical protein
MAIALGACSRSTRTTHWSPGSYCGEFLGSAPWLRSDRRGGGAITDAAQRVEPATDPHRVSVGLAQGEFSASETSAGRVVATIAPAGQAVCTQGGLPVVRPETLTLRGARWNRAATLRTAVSSCAVLKRLRTGAADRGDRSRPQATGHRRWLSSTESVGTWSDPPGRASIGQLGSPQADQALRSAHRVCATSARSPCSTRLVRNDAVVIVSLPGWAAKSMLLLGRATVVGGIATALREAGDVVSRSPRHADRPICADAPPC